MDKIAQKRNVFNKLREMTNLSGIALENVPFLNSGFKELMDDLRMTDDRIRAIATGQQIGEAESPENPISLKDLLNKAQTNFNRKEYMSSLADLGLFHEKFHEIVKTLELFHAKIDSVHEKFLIEGLDDETKEKLRRLKKRMAERKQLLVKEAGILDFLAKIYNNRRSALKAWESRYPNQVKKIKTDLNSLLQKSKSIFTQLIGRLKEMASARATRKVDNFDEASKKIIRLYAVYNAKFVEVYSTVKNFMDKIEEKEEELAESAKPSSNLSIKGPGEQATQNVQEMPKTRDYEKIPSTKDYPEESFSKMHVSHQPPQTDSKKNVEFDLQGLPISPPPTVKELRQIKPQISERAQSIPAEVLQQFKSINPEKKPSSAVAPPTLVSDVLTPPEKITDTEKDTSKVLMPGTKRYDNLINEVKPADTLRTGGSYNRFIESLESMSNESPLIIRSYILKYAKSIKNKDVETYNKLVDIINNIGV